MIKRTPAEMGNVFRSLMDNVAATKSPPPVHLTVIESADQLNAGYVWCDYQGTRVRCQITTSNDYTVGEHVILALPLGSGTTNDYIEVGSIYNGADNSRFPRIRVSSISDANGNPVNSVAHSTDDVTVPPTSAELVTAFGSASAKGAGFTATLDDNGAGTTVYIIVSDGTDWFYSAALTKAV